MLPDHSSLAGRFVDSSQEGLRHLCYDRLGRQYRGPDSQLCGLVLIHGWNGCQRGFSHHGPRLFSLCHCHSVAHCFHSLLAIISRVPLRKCYHVCRLLLLLGRQHCVQRCHDHWSSSSWLMRHPDHDRACIQVSNGWLGWLGISFRRCVGLALYDHLASHRHRVDVPQLQG